MTLVRPSARHPETSLRAPNPGWRARTTSTLRSLVCAAAASVAFAACIPPVAPAVEGPVSNARGEECRGACVALGMELTSVVLIMNHAGCVCQIIPAPLPASPEAPSSQDKGAAAAAGGAAVAAVLAAQEEEERQRRSHDDDDRRRRQQDDDRQRQQQQQQQQMQQHWQTPTHH